MHTQNLKDYENVAFRRSSLNLDKFTLYLYLVLPKHMQEAKSSLSKKWFCCFSQYLDIGEDLNVPDDFTEKEMETGRWWRHLVAGAAAGNA